MNRNELEHIIRAAAANSGDHEIVVIGSQAILGQFPDAPRTLRQSMEADVYPRNFPERADVIDGAMGELSMFHQTFGYYADGVGPHKAVVPSGWETRLIAVKNANTGGATGWCLEVHDLILSKYAAFRDKDLAFAAEAVRLRLVRKTQLLRRLETLPVDPELRVQIAQRIALDFGAGQTRA